MEIFLETTVPIREDGYLPSSLISPCPPQVTALCPNWDSSVRQTALSSRHCPFLQWVNERELNPKFNAEFPQLPADPPSRQAEVALTPLIPFRGRNRHPCRSPLRPLSCCVSDLCVSCVFMGRAWPKMQTGRIIKKLKKRTTIGGRGLSFSRAIRDNAHFM